ncbi:hypothetical protein EP227_05325 [bacterium]|nr:MAG: hypothetical protein EP227_05325 [bacterium]
MREKNGTFFCCLLAFIALILCNPTTLFAVQEDATHKPQPKASTEEVPFDRPVEEIQKYLGPRNELDLYPCSDCHDEDWEADPERRELDEPHNEIPGKFVNHDSENRWCLDCHSAQKRDKLILLNGELIDFDEYYRVCAQCHKRVFREWKMGVHGKRTGYWKGDQEYMQCVKCHDPHDPPFKPLKPMPAPRKPGKVRLLSKEAKK